MKLFRPMVLAMMAGLLLSSCIKEEALNAEADITDVMVDGTTLVRKPVITNNEVLFYVNGWEDLTNLAPMFKLTEGAKIEPESGTKLNFTQPQSYTVTSQDGQWKKTYKVSFVSNDVATDYHLRRLRLILPVSIILSLTKRMMVILQSGVVVTLVCHSLWVIVRQLNTQQVKQKMVMWVSV